MRAPPIKRGSKESMERENVKKLVTVSYLGSAILAYVVVNVLFKSLAGAFGFVQKWYGVEWVNHGLPILAAVTTFFVLQFNSKILNWTEEVILEVSKVVWPSRKDTVAMTVVVCVFVGIASGILFVIDIVSRNLVELIIR